MPDETIGERIRRVRQERGLSQRQVASPGVSAAYVSRIEAGERQPSVKALRLLASRLGVSAEYLETGSALDPAGRRDWMLSEAEVHLRLGNDMAVVERDFRGVLADAVAARDESAAARARAGLGRVATIREAYAEALEHLEAATATGALSPQTHPDVYATLARVYLTLGLKNRMVAFLELCLEQLGSPDSSRRVAYVRFATYLSHALAASGDLPRAHEVLQDAASGLDDVADPMTRVRLYWSQATLAASEGNEALARTSIERAIALLELMEDRYYLAHAHALYGQTLLTEGRVDEARARFELAERLFGDQATTRDRAELQLLRAELAVLEEKFGDVEAIAEEVLRLVRKQFPALQGRARLVLGRAHAATGDLDRAVRSYAEAEPLLERGDRPRLTQLYEAWSEALERGGQLTEAIELVRKALAVESTAGATFPGRGDKLPE